MAHDAYFLAEGIEAEHHWVNEWSAPHGAAARAQIAVPSETGPRAEAGTPAAADAPRAAEAAEAERQLRRDMAEIAAARDALDRAPANRGLRLAVGGAFGLAILTALGALARW